MLRRPDTKHANLALRLAAVGAAALLAGACAGPVAYQQPTPAWRLDGAPVPETQTYSAAPDRREDWAADPSYEYRGGRDPKTGRAYIQM
jgi:hypothetical protein